MNLCRLNSCLGNSTHFFLVIVSCQPDVTTYNPVITASSARQGSKVGGRWERQVVKGTFKADGASGHHEGGSDFGAWTSHMFLIRVLFDLTEIDMTSAEESAEYYVVVTSAVSHQLNRIAS
jgi:hypothetical protein